MAACAASELRAKGNDFHKAGKLEEAIELYYQASEQAPQDARPLSNLSAAYFELGDYTSAITAVDQALPLIVDANAKQKLYLRKTKAQFYVLDFENARLTTEHVLDPLPQEELQQCISTTLGSRLSVQDARAVHRKIITEIPRIKPQILPVNVYFPIGHDVPKSLYDIALAKTDKPEIALMFGGIGDGRHLFASLITIHALEGQTKNEPPKYFHLTIVDHKPAIIARNFIMLTMLADLAEARQRGKDYTASRQISALYYVFLAPIIPPAMHAILQDTIQEIIDALEGRRESHPFLDLLAVSTPAVLQVLAEWQYEVGARYPPAILRPYIVENCFLDASKAPPGCEKQEAFYQETAILVLADTGRGLGSELQKAFDEFNPASTSTVSQEVLQTTESTWKTNPTLIDLDYAESWDEKIPNPPALCHNPFRFGENLLTGGFAKVSHAGLLPYLQDRFINVADSITHLGDRLKIEACVGDITYILEQIRYGLLGHRQQTEASTSVESAFEYRIHENLSKLALGYSRDPKTYPQLFDKIHLSNIPDYVGGSLSTFLYGMPLVKPGPACYVSSRCLRDLQRYKTEGRHHNEYIGLSAPSDLKRAFEFRTEGEDPTPEHPIAFEGYTHYNHEPMEITSAARMPREQLQQWLFRLFLKLAIPKERDQYDWRMLYSPPNLTILLRLCGHLHHVDYPAHWISGVLDDICSGKIATKARPPRSAPLLIEEVRMDLPPLNQSTAPFVAELTTLLGLWQFALPFGVLSTHVPHIDTIHKYSITFGSVSDVVPNKPHFVLLLFDAKVFPEATMLRKLMLSDEMGAKGQSATKARDKVHMVTTWKWDAVCKTAEFWLRSDIMEALHAKASPWMVQIWRVDSWSYQSMPLRLTECCDQGRFWTGEA